MCTIDSDFRRLENAISYIVAVAENGGSVFSAGDAMWAMICFCAHARRDGLGREQKHFNDYMHKDQMYTYWNHRPEQHWCR